MKYNLKGTLSWVGAKLAGMPSMPSVVGTPLRIYRPTENLCFYVDNGNRDGLDLLLRVKIVTGRPCVQ